MKKEKKQKVDEKKEEEKSVKDMTKAERKEKMQQLTQKRKEKSDKRKRQEQEQKEEKYKQKIDSHRELLKRAAALFAKPKKNHPQQPLVQQKWLQHLQSVLLVNRFFLNLLQIS